CIGGAPGVYSSRFAGPEEDDAKNREKLIEMTSDFSEEKRRGRFVSVITLIHPCGKTLVARGECEGIILAEERGEKGFGYDSMFMPEGYSQTFGEIDPEEKNRISHRAKALSKMEELFDKEIFDN
ncbi:MAG: non-canonical purine NTP pyrophosphatase, partial [Anaerovoracaceae bacterium]